MATISGKDGTVSFSSSVADATSWSLTVTSNNPSFASSDTSGFKTRVAGVKDATGSYSAKYGSGDTLPGVGDSASLVLGIDASNTLTVTALIESVNIEVDMDDGDVVGYSVDWGAQSSVVQA